MEIKPSLLNKHASTINSVLQETCGSPNPTPLVQSTDGVIRLAPSCPEVLCREVTTDLGIREIALRLPVPDKNQPRFWVALHEYWEWKGKHRLSFRTCALRLYMGDRSEEAIQFLRLEWMAPSMTEEGIQIYPAKHAGHPHWHIDASALAAPTDYYRSLESLTAPPTASQTGVEEFMGAQLAEKVSAQPVLDFSWLQKLHIPARAEWMRIKWDGIKVPAPHQSEPTNLTELDHWWMGALRYVSTELPRCIE